jgi:hypothetical protein
VDLVQRLVDRVAMGVCGALQEGSVDVEEQQHGA